MLRFEGYVVAMRTVTGPKAATIKGLTRYATLAREAPPQRDEYMQRMRREGATVKQIAETAKMTPAGVSRILHKPSSGG